ncbi:2-dehydro-3-deoxygalactonokinase [Pseudochelatococcus sp. B33]
MTTAGDSPALIVLDWGTSSLRAWLIDGEGQPIEAARAPLGLMQIVGRNFAAAFDAVAGAWRARWPHLPALAAGMVGAAQGWVEAPYLPCPAGPDELAGALAAVPERNLFIVPGVIQRTPANVMRGEETQVAGALALRPDLAGRSRLVLPGTHSKWVRVEEGRITGFDSWMTGELFAVLKEHSILGRFSRDGAAAPGAEAADAAFLAGVDAARAAGRASGLYFSARARVLAGELVAGAALDYLSGLLIGEEIAAALTPGETPLLIGDPVLCRRYRMALARFGAAGAEEIPDAALAGLRHVANAAGLATLEIS